MLTGRFHPFSLAKARALFPSAPGCQSPFNAEITHCVSIIQKLLNSGDSRITLDGVLILKSQQFRTQEKNREAALERLKQIIILASQTLTPRRPTRPTRNSQIKRLDTKTKQARTKALRKNNSLSDY